MLQDLRQLAQEHGQCEIVLRMEFKRGLHPFFPPSIQLVRPRCRAPLIGALSSHPMLQLAHWDPWRPQKDLIEQLQLFLQVRSLLSATASVDRYLAHSVSAYKMIVLQPTPSPTPSFGMCMSVMAPPGSVQCQYRLLRPVIAGNTL